MLHAAKIVLFAKVEFHCLVLSPGKSSVYPLFESIVPSFQLSEYYGFSIITADLTGDG